MGKEKKIGPENQEKIQDKKEKYPEVKNVKAYPKITANQTSKPP